MKRNSRFICWIKAALVVYAFLVCCADSIAGMAVTPLQQWVTVKPGKEASFSLTVSNTNRETETRLCTVGVSVVDFTVSPQGTVSFGAQLKHPRSAVEWITFNPSEFILEPGESKEIEARVSAPANADGDYWAAIMVRLGNSGKHKEGVRVNLQTASGVFIHVARRNYIERASVMDARVIMPEFAHKQVFAEESALEVTIQEAEIERAFKIHAELKNDGLVAFLASGKALLYSGDWRRAASIPLYTSRRRVFPGHSRWFTGVMSQPLPAGHYKMRVFFDCDSKYGRKVTRDMEFSVSDELARQWAEDFTDSDAAQVVDIEPKELNLTVTPGRFTSARLLVANQSLSTVRLECRLENDGLPEGWLELKSPEVTLDQNMRRNMVCLVRIPADAQLGQYKGTLHLEVERSGLTIQGKTNVGYHEIPISIAVSEPLHIAASK
ncbi:MAG TPA: hypothetical protein VMX13_02540 [Sedimentisphaerales bacterium]|nr:hypothetical protein [Sedimentisphaerales bacterium]